ncbi:phage head-tail adapter protein [Sutcliffiella horikoshii]|uniref:phage head-tail adapter protein n=1 Tax=Sutcliffiella horikoshii TaxID=79883 RepID=UPI001CA452FF|nr:phage head-tail adapter protein [Sutcliffiella horikoshii]
MFDHELILISLSPAENSMGDPIVEETSVTVLCDVQAITRSEHYAAATHGLKPELTFVLNKYEYEGQRLVEFENVRYRVIRHYFTKTQKDFADFESVELVCEGLMNNAST